MTENEINPHGVKVGQVWRDMDKRNPEVRYLRVTEVILADGQARVIRCNPDGGTLWGKYPARPIKLTRFKPTHTGYLLVKDVTA